jgi:hypothetical protein
VTAKEKDLPILLYRVRGRSMDTLARARTLKYAAQSAIDVFCESDWSPAPTRLWVTLLAEPVGEGLVYEAEQTEVCFVIKNGRVSREKRHDH